MSAQEAEETQSAYGDSGAGPGAPTPLSALEVLFHLLFLWPLRLTFEIIGSSWDHCSRCQVDRRWRLQHNRIGGIYVRKGFAGSLGECPLIQRRPRRLLEQIKGISEQKASKILAEGLSYLLSCTVTSAHESLQHRSWYPWALPQQPRCTNGEANSYQSPQDPSNLILS